MYTLELDWALDTDTYTIGDVLAEAARVAAYIDVDVQVASLSGPGGGWPVFRFTGPKPVLAAILWGYDNDLVPDEHIDVAYPCKGCGELAGNAIHDGPNIHGHEFEPPHTRYGKADGPWPYGATHDLNCPACVADGSSFTPSPRSETYWSS